MYLHFALGRLRESDLKLVMEELRGLEEKWKLIAKELRKSIPGGMRVDDIKYSDTIDCLRYILRKWLESPYYTGKLPSWKIIIDALRSAGKSQVADHLKAKYIPGELTTTTSSQYSLESQHEECVLLCCD